MSKPVWLSGVPDSWSVAPLYARYEVQLGKMLDAAQFTGDHPRPYLRNVDVRWGTVNLTDLPMMDFDSRDRAKFSLCPGDLLVCEGGEIGRTAIWSGELEECYFQKAIHRLRPRVSSECPRYMFYALRAAADYGLFAADSNPNTIPHLTAEKLRRHRFPFPPPHDQRAIADFLDRETTRIDALIDGYRQMIDLRQEEVTSLVLSKMNSPTTEKLRLGNAARVVSKPVAQKEGELYTPIGLFNRGRGLFHKDPRESDDMGDSDFFWIEEGDLIISGQFAWEGAVALACSEDAGCVVSHRYHVLRGRDGIALTEYLLALLSTEVGDFLLNENSRGAAGRNRPLNINSLLKEKIPVPDPQAQKKVAKAVHRINRLARETSEQVRHLQEYRSALISAAVTGQINVRTYRPQEAAALCQ
jgi:type I restriction enzyme S subunit